jgi:hypothetical protein
LWAHEREDEDRALDLQDTREEATAYERPRDRQSHSNIAWQDVSGNVPSGGTAPEFDRMIPVRLTLFLDGDHWCALLGHNVTVGVVGFGESVNEAVRDLGDHVEAEHRNWLEFEEE